VDGLQALWHDDVTFGNPVAQAALAGVGANAGATAGFDGEIGTRTGPLGLGAATATTIVAEGDTPLI